LTVSRGAVAIANAWLIEHGSVCEHVAVSAPDGDAYAISAAATHMPFCKSQTLLEQSSSVAQARQLCVVASHVGALIGH
jgi:hypothetical protein